MSLNLPQRPRRNRQSAANRGLTRETSLSVSDLIFPMFVCEGSGEPEPISTLPGQHRWPISHLVEECKRNAAKGLRSVNLFGYSENKDDSASASWDPDGLIPRAVRTLKAELPDLNVQTDIALDPYTEHGHDGLVVHGEIVNDPTVEALCKMAVCHAEAGVDWVCPSDMMDGRVGAIRHRLDMKGYPRVSILAYTAKYASCFYGPFRGALDSAPKSGDKKTYQMDPANRREAIRETILDANEGADAIMVKPAGLYLDVVSAVRDACQLPIAAYQVSGEYAMIMAAAEKNWIDLDRAVIESALCIKRAGADMILTYFAPFLADYLQKEPEL